MALLILDPNLPDTVLRATRRAVLMGVVITAVLLSLTSLNYSQEPDDLSRIAPPPARIITKEEKDLLGSESETKKVTKIALELMESRMKKAEAADSQDNFEGMFIELGSFHALMDYTLAFLLDKHSDGRKAFNDFKRFELGLRGYTPRLELIRRDLPIKYEYYVRTLQKYLREARSKAIDPLFGDSVVRDKNN